MGAQLSDHAVADLARRQHGRITWEQLLELGIGRGAIRRRVAAGRLHREHRGVYAVGHRAPTREGRWMAAVLACGPGAVLSHRSAAWLWGLREGDRPCVDVTIGPEERRRRAGIAIHQGALAPADRTMRLDIPVTSVARTLADLAHVLDPTAFTRAVRQAQFQRLFDTDAVRDALTRRPAAVLGRFVDDHHPTQSTLEDRLLAVCRRHRLPTPQTQISLAGRRVDFLWARERLVVEVDGWQAHGTRHAFQHDRAAMNDLGLRGYLVLRFTWQDVRDRPAGVARQIAAALARGMDR